MSSDVTIVTHVSGPMANNSYAVIDGQSGLAAIVDPGFGSEEILDELPEHSKVCMVLLTHGHFDHVAGVNEIVEKTQAPVGVHAADRQLMLDAPVFADLFGIAMPPPHPPSFEVVPAEPIALGSTSIEVRHTPGHSPGGVTFVIGGSALVGDSIFAGSIGRTDLPGADFDDLIKSIREQILTLGDDTELLSGHGPATTVARERLTNPFLMGSGLRQSF